MLAFTLLQYVANMHLIRERYRMQCDWDFTVVTKNETITRFIPKKTPLFRYFPIIRTFHQPSFDREQRSQSDFRFALNNKYVSTNSV